MNPGEIATRLLSVYYGSAFFEDIADGELLAHIERTLTADRVRYTSKWLYTDAEKRAAIRDRANLLYGRRVDDFARRRAAMGGK